MLDYTLHGALVAFLLGTVADVAMVVFVPVFAYRWWTRGTERATALWDGLEVATVATIAVAFWVVVIRLLWALHGG